jgi:hypothetical protein
MKMVSAGAGLGVAVKDYRVILVFDNDKAFTQFPIHRSGSALIVVFVVAKFAREKSRN